FSARRTRGLHGSSFSRHRTLDCGGSNLLTFHTRLARATRTAFAAALAIAATTPSASTTAGTTATTAAATTLFLGGARFACFAEDLADAFVLVAVLARCRGGTLRARQRSQDLAGDRFDRDLLFDVGLDIRQ